VPELTRELRRMADDAARLARPLAAGEVIRRGDRRRRRSFLRRSAGGLSAAGIVAAAVLAVTALGPAGHRPRVQLAAWTVARLPNGEVSVRIIKLRDPAALQRKLRAEGIPASVVTGPPGPCRRYPASQALLNRVFPGSYRLAPPPGDVIVIRPSALPRGAGVQLAGSIHRLPRRGYVAAPILVYASPRCVAATSAESPASQPGPANGAA
jgi:hypothetical protein